MGTCVEKGHIDLPEKVIENQILGWLKANDICAFKVKSMGTFDPKIKRFRSPSPWYKKGCPDILVCYRGRFVGLEVKTRTGRVSPVQLAFHNDVRRHSGYVFVVRSVDDVERVFNSFLALVC